MEWRAEMLVEVLKKLKVYVKATWKTTIFEPKEKTQLQGIVEYS